MSDDPEDQAIDVTIEALTGTVYDLCVSPFETILGIKLKIQRLEGIPVYQQHLVYGGVELQDEFCLEEYGVRSGAQLKLLVAMRGGPIHAHRVYLDDPTLLEIAELLEGSVSDHKYTVMLLSRDGDAVDLTDFVQLYNEDSCESVRSSCSPVQVTESRHKATQTEHALTRDKMKELMTKLRKEKGFKPIAARPSGSQLQRSGTKVLILESRASSRLLQSSSGHGQSPLHLTPPYHTERRVSAAHRRLRFCSSEECTCSRGKTLGVRGVGKRARSPDEETPIQSRKHYPRVEGVSHRPPRREWRKSVKRTRRTSCLNDKQSSETQGAESIVEDLNTQMSQLALGTGTCSHGVSGGKPKGCLLPQISSAHRPTPFPLMKCSAARNTQGVRHEHLPPLVSVPSAAIQQSTCTSRKKNRCMQCGKKMGLATTYTCRCGGIFCAIHRYAEVHSCTFDYKAEGRQIIARNNPVVTASKLPKI